MSELLEMMEHFQVIATIEMERFWKACEDDRLERQAI